jgi:hypothetical protein
VLVAMGVFHQWWLCNSGGCSGVVCSKSGADLHSIQTRLSDQTGKEMLEGTVPKLVRGAHCPPEQASKAHR